MRNRYGIGRFKRRASVMVQTVAFGSTVAVGVAALAVDTGLMFSAKQELQTAADAAALAAASQLGKTDGDPFVAARAEAAKYAEANNIMGEGADLVEADVVFGHAVKNGDKFDFVPNSEPYDAVQVTLRRDATVADGPVSLFFGQTLGMNTADLGAKATAMVVPRDIALVVDLSGSMNDDSEFYHYKEFQSEKSGTIDGVQINLKDIWASLPIEKGNAGVGNGIDPPPPGQPNNENDQPGTGPGSPANAGGNPDPGASGASGGTAAAGPRWGWMTAWGEDLTLGSYDATNDWGLYYIKKNQTTTDADVIENITQAGYSSEERSALLSSSNDGNSTLYRNRVKVLLGLAGWRSKKDESKYNGGPGDGDNKVESNELWQEADYPFDSGSWDDWINYVRSGSTRMEQTDPDLRYRYGIKTVTNYLLEKKAGNNKTPELVNAPEMPLYSVKDAVSVMIDEIIRLKTDDHVSLETFAQYGNHRMDLTVPSGNQSLADMLRGISEGLYQYQAAHSSSVTNIGAGMDRAINELSSARSRTAASKYVVLLTDGKPNVNSSNKHVGNNNAQAVGWAMDRAEAAQNMGMTVFTIGVGGDVNEEMLIDMASHPDKYYYADNNPDPDNGGVPLYVNQLREIFQTIAGRTPVQLIQ